MTKGTVAGLLLAVAAMMLIIAGYNALSTVTVTSGGSVSCGSWMNHDNAAAERSDFIDSIAYGGDSTRAKDKCSDAISDRTPKVAVFGILGLALGVTGAVIAPSGRREPSAE